MRISPAILWLAILGLLGGMAEWVQAQDVDPNFDYYKEPGLYPTRAYVNQHFSEHIDPHTGKLQHHYTDIFIPGNGGMDLRIQRSYTSVDDAGPVGQVPYEVTPFGVGWTIHFGRVLRRSSISICNTNFSSGQQMPVLELPDGSRQILFRDDLYFPDKQKFVSTSRWRAECIDSGGLRVFSPEGTRYEMTHLGAVGTSPNSLAAWYSTLITDRNGNTISISYKTLSGGTHTVPETVTTSDGRTVTFAYSDNPARLDQVETDGRIWSYTFNTDQSNSAGPLLTQVTLPAGGGNWTYAYKTTGSPAMRRVTYPQGGYIDYTYQQKTFTSGPSAIDSTAILQKTTSDNGTWSFSFTPSTGLDIPDSTQVTAPNGVTTYTHYGYGGVAHGDFWRVGLLIEKTIGTEQTEKYIWSSQQISNQANKRPGSTLDADPATRAPHLTKKEVIRNGNTHTTDYSNFDLYRNPQTIVESSTGFSRTTNFTYQVNPTLWIIRQVKDETIVVAGFPDFSITRTIDATNGNVTSETRFGVRTDYVYDASNGNVLERKNARGHTTMFGNYFRGIPQLETPPIANNAVTRVVSSAGNVTSETDGENETTGYGFDALNRLSGVKAIDYPRGADVAISHPAPSQTVISRGSLTQTVNFDGFGRLSCVVKTDTLSPSQDAAVKITHDPLGQRTFVSYPAALSGGTCPTSLSTGTSMSYDILGRVKTVTHPGPSSRTYDYLATQVEITNERGINHTYSYRAFGDPDKRELMGIDIPSPNQAASITIQRNPIGRITSVKQEDVTRTYGYDAPGNFLTSITEPETGITTYGRDENGNMTSRSIGESPTTNFVYDEMDRLTQTDYPDGTANVNRTYYRNSLLKTANSSVAQRYFEYDANRNLTLDRLTVDPSSQTPRVYELVNAYSDNDGLLSITYPFVSAVNYDPNGRGRPRKATPFANTVDFDRSGALSSIAFANGVTTSISLSARLWPERMTSSAPAVIADFQYGYDGIGNVTTYTDHRDASRSMLALAYDSIDRLISADTAGGETRSYSYNGSGDLLTQVRGGPTLTYKYDPTRRLASIENAPKPYSFAYDVYGNVVNNGVTAFQYNDASQMKCANCAGANETLFAYDGLDMRVRMQKGGVTTYFMHAQNGQLMMEHTPVTADGGAEIKEYAYLLGRQIGVMTRTLAGTTTSPTSNFFPAPVNSPITIGVNVSGSKPTGDVTFRAGTTVLGTVAVVNGVATLTVAPGVLDLGEHTISATYNGDVNNSSSSTSFPLNVYTLDWLPPVLDFILNS